MDVKNGFDKFMVRYCEHQWMSKNVLINLRSVIVTINGCHKMIS